MYSDWHDGGLYDGATQAQGMTLADLIYERMWHNPLITEVDNDTAPGEYCALKSGMVSITNNSSLAWTWTEGSSGGSIESGKTVMVGGYTGATLHINRVSSQVYVRFLEEAPEVWEYGLEFVDLPPGSPYCAGLWARVATRVNERYYKRYLAGETLDEWQRLLQVRTDAIVPRIERALQLYDNTDIGQAVTAGVTTEYLDVTDQSTSGTKSESKGKVSATADQSINESESYAGQTTQSSNESSDTRSNTKTGKIRQTQMGNGGILPQLNISIEEWKDLETILVNEYRTCFMSFIWS